MNDLFRDVMFVVHLVYSVRNYIIHLYPSITRALGVLSVKISFVTLTNYLHKL